MSAPVTSLPEVVAPFSWREAGELRWIEAKIGSATAAFSTRLGGVSEGAYRSLNLGVLTDDDRDRVLGNRRALTAALARDVESIVMGRQVHGTEVQVRQTAPEPGTALREADAQITGAPDLTPSTRPQMLAFERRLKQRGVEAVLRRSRGLDISAACGQLRVEVEAEEHAHIE